MNKRTGWLVMTSLILGTLGCAHINVHKVAPNASDEGIRFYRPSPYLWITLGEKGCVPSIEYLPDYSQEYVIEPHYWIGSLAFKPTLEHGWNLTAYDSTVDTKVPETLNALAGLMEKAGKIAAPAPGAAAVETSAGFGPGLYRLVFDTIGDKPTGRLIEVSPVFQMRDAQGNPLVCPGAQVSSATRSPGSQKR